MKIRKSLVTQSAKLCCYALCSIERLYFKLPLGIMMSRVYKLPPPHPTQWRVFDINFSKKNSGCIMSISSHVTNAGRL